MKVQRRKEVLPPKITSAFAQVQDIYPQNLSGLEECLATTQMLNVQWSPRKYCPPTSSPVAPSARGDHAQAWPIPNGCQETDSNHPLQSWTDRDEAQETPQVSRSWPDAPKMMVSGHSNEPGRSLDQPH